MYEDIINATDNVLRNLTNSIPQNMTNTISANVTSTISSNVCRKKVRYEMDRFILHIFYIFCHILFIVITQNTSKNKKKKTHWRANNLKLKNNELKNVSIRSHTCYYFGDINKIENFDFDNILLHEK